MRLLQPQRGKDETRQAYRFRRMFGNRAVKVYLRGGPAPWTMARVRTGMLRGMAR